MLLVGAAASLCPASSGSRAGPPSRVEVPAARPPRSSTRRAARGTPGPEPETAKPMSMYAVKTPTTGPRWRSASSARRRRALVGVRTPCIVAAIPSRTMAGVFGIARITGTPSGRRLSYQSVESPAATESSVCPEPSAGAISARSAAASCRLYRDDHQRGARGGGGVVGLDRCPVPPAELLPRSSRRAVSVRSAGLRHPDQSATAHRAPRRAARAEHRRRGPGAPRTPARRRLGARPNSQLAPNSRIASMIGSPPVPRRSACTRRAGGDSGKLRRTRMPSASSAFSRSASVRGEIPGQALSSSLKRRGPSDMSCRRIGVHFDAMMSAVAATAQLPVSWTWRIVLCDER